MDRIPKRTWHYMVTILMLATLGICIAVEIIILRRVPAALGRFVPFLTFLSNIILYLALRPEEAIPIWIVPMLKLGVLFAAVAVYIIAITVLSGCAHEGAKS